MKPAVTLSHIRQLCCSGLGGQVVMPALLPALRHWIPNCCSHFGWADDNDHLANVYAETLPGQDVLDLYMREFCNKPEREGYFGFTEFLQSGVLVENTCGALAKPFLNSELYDLFIRPLGVRYGLRAVIRENGHRRGVLVAYREPGAPAFGEQDNRRLASLIPYIAHALADPPPQLSDYDDYGEQGLIILDGQGRLQHLSPRARYLLYLAERPRVAPDILARRSDSALRRRLSRLAVDLAAIFQDQAVSAPLFLHKNAWGQFIFRAHRLEPHSSPGVALVGVTVRHQVPRVIRLLDAMQAWPLSARQRELCLLLAQDLSYAVIAGRMGITQHTVTHYVRLIYDKLGVHQRSELLAKLLSGDPVRH